MADSKGAKEKNSELPVEVLSDEASKALHLEGEAMRRELHRRLATIKSPSVKVFRFKP